MTPTKLARLLIGEVSGVDDPANEVPGWMVVKSEAGVAAATSYTSGRSVGPDQTWDVGAAEARVREATGATEAPNKKYASAFLWYDGDAEDGDGNGVPDRFGDYKFLVADVVDGELVTMPRAVNAAASRLPNSTIPAGDKDQVAAVIDKLQAKIESAQKAVVDEDATSIVGKIKGLLQGKEDIDMNKDELNAALDERFGALDEKLAALSKSVEAPATEVGNPPAPEGAGETTKESGDGAGDTLAIDDVVKGIETALEPYNEILEKILDRLASVEKAYGVRTSLEGQETPGTEEAKPTVKDAIGAAMRGLRVDLR